MGVSEAIHHAPHYFYFVMSTLLDLYSYKSYYLTYSQGYEEIDLDTFLEYVFMFDNTEEFPFEDKECEEYIRWKENEAKKRYKVGQPYAYNPIVILEVEKEDKRGNAYKGKENRLILRGDNEILYQIRGRANAFMSPITYVGHRASYKNARFIFALAFDLDGVGEWQIRDLFHQIGHEDKAIRLPRPNIVVNSGNGLHLYYLLAKPIPMYDDHIKILNQLKHSLTTKIWNAYTSSYPEKQYQGIVQSFRLPESLTKFGEPIRAFRDSGVPLWTIEALNSYTQSKPLTLEQVEFVDKGKRIPNRLTLEGAKLRYPDWYERRIVRGDKKKKKWSVKRSLYDWWLNRLLTNENKEIKDGHRYNCLLTLVCFAVKCSVPYDEVKEAVFKLVPRLDAYTEREDNHFTIADGKAALKAYKSPDSAKKTREWIEKHTNFRIKENKRNGQNQADHLEIARAIRDIKMKQKGKGDWREGNGRKPKKELVVKWRKENPEGNKSACSRETGLSRPTVIKWWNC